MQPAAVGVIGGSGYSGIETVRLLARHPAVELRFVTSDRWQGERVADRLGLTLPNAAPDLRFSPFKAGKAEKALVDLASSCQAVLLATPAEVSAALVPALLAAGDSGAASAAQSGPKLIDLSGAFRLRDPAAYPSHYGFAHPAPALLGEAVYGLPELAGASIAAARLVANPGCYATAASLALAPLLAADLLEPDSLIVDAASGVTGAGRKASEDFSFAEVADDFRAYKVLRHQHGPELLQTLQAAAQPGAAGPLVQLAFTPHLLPIRRGILATCYALLRPHAADAAAKAIQTAFAQAYPELPSPQAGFAGFVRLRSSPEAVSVRQVVHTNRCDLGWRIDGRRLVIVAAIDNLLKGAAGQAIQNLNLMLGLPERTGLDQLAGPPA